MSGSRLIVVGGGEHARVVLEAILARPGGYTVEGFVDPSECNETVRRFGVERLGGDEALQGLGDVFAVIGIGATGVSRRRAEVVARLSPFVRGWACVVHPHAWVAPSALIGEGTVVFAGAVVQSGASLGRHCVVNTGAIVEHDVVLGDFAQLGPRAVVGGGGTVGAGAFIGLGASVRDHRRVGSDALVGMGSVVVEDVAAEMCVTGVPARIMRIAR